MTVLVIGAGLVGSQIARILVEQGERPVLMDRAPQPKALGEIVDLAKVKIVEGDVLQPFALPQIVRAEGIKRIVHMAANPMLTIGAQKDPYAAIQLNIMGTANVLETARVLGIERVVVASSNVLNHHLTGGDGGGDPMHEEGFPRPLSIYSACKQAVESIGLNYARWYGLEFAALRYGAVAGPWGGAGGGGPSNVFLAMIRAAMQGDEAVIPASVMEWPRCSEDWCATGPRCARAQARRAIPSTTLRVSTSAPRSARPTAIRRLVAAFSTTSR